MQVKNLVKNYQLKTQVVEALKGVSFDLPDRGMVFVLGKSGCGKSTLLNMLSGLDGFDSGDVIYKGKSLKNFTVKELDGYRNSCCGFIFQEYNLIPELNIRDNIALALELQGEKEVDAKIAEALNKVELSGYEKRKVSELSGGQKQRVTLARAIIKDPEVIFADEPSGALDSKTGESVFGLLKELSKEKLVVVVSHDTESANKYGDRIIELSDGEIIKDTDEGYKEEAINKETCVSKPSKMPLKTAIKIGCSNFKYHPIRLLATVILAMMAFSFLGLSLNPVIETVTSVTYDTMEKHGVRFSGVQKEKTLFDGDKYYTISTYLTEEDRQEVARHCSVALPVVENGGIENMGEVDSKFYFPPAAFSSITEDEARSLGFKISGILPKTEDEIAVTEYTARTISKAGLSGENVTMDTIIGKVLTVDGKDYKVTAIVDTNMNYDRYEKTDDNDFALLAEFQSEMTYGPHNVLFVSSPGDFDSFEVFNSYMEFSSREVWQFSTIARSNDNVVVVGKKDGIYLPKRYIISQFAGSNRLDVLLEKTELYWESSGDKYLETAVNNGFKGTKEELYDILFSNTFYAFGIDANDVFYEVLKDDSNFDMTITLLFGLYSLKYEFSVKGFNNGEAILCDDGIYDMLYEKMGYVYDNLIVMHSFVGRANFDYFTEHVSDEGIAYKMTNYVIESMSEMSGKIETLKKLMTYLAVAFALFAVVLLLNFMFTSVSEKMSTIGILNSLGSSNGNLIKIFVLEGTIVGAAVFALTLGFHALLGYIFSYFFSAASGSIYIAVFGFTPLVALVLLGIIGVFSVIGCILPVIRLAKIKPAQLYKDIM